MGLASIHSNHQNMDVGSHKLTTAQVFDTELGRLGLCRAQLCAMADSLEL